VSSTARSRRNTFMDISVIICSYNPRSDYLRRTLDSLKNQTLGQTHWEFILVDNNSEAPLRGRTDLSWHVSAKVVEESEQGLTAARLCGIREAAGELLVFVDDDNVLSEDYLEQAGQLFSENALLGCAGCDLAGEFEVPPPVGSERYLTSLAIRKVDRPVVSNTRSIGSKPFGAGMVVRGSIAAEYLSRTAVDVDRKSLGRIGGSLGGCEDIDIAMTSCELGFYCGLFPQLKIIHLISEGRLQWSYLRRIARDARTSYVKLCLSRGLPVMSRMGVIKGALQASIRLVLLKTSLNGFRVEMAVLLGAYRGLRT
jgi:glycosyltransferase involved in cell wall biosynthesis